MQFELTPAADRYIRAHGGAVTISAVFAGGCCAPALPPEVRPGPPPDPDGFARYSQDGIEIYFDSLLAERGSVTIDLKEYGKLQELALAD